MTGRPKRAPKRAAMPRTIRDLMRPNAFEVHSPAQQQATADAWAKAAARASKIAPKGIIGGKSGG